MHVGQLAARSEIVNAVRDKYPDMTEYDAAMLITIVLNEHPLVIARAMGGLLRTETHHHYLSMRRDTIVLPWRETAHE